MKVNALFFALTCSTLLNLAAGYRCEREGAEYRFFDGETEVPAGRFPCLKVTTDSSSTLHVQPPTVMAAPLKCPAVQDGKASVKVKYEKVDVNTGIMCTLKCKDDAGQYRCLQKAEGEECLCEPQKPQVVVRPIASEIGAGTLLGGQSDISQGAAAHLCDDKPLGFQFPDAVPCISVRAEVTKRRVKYTKRRQDRCRVTMKPEMETRYMETSADNVNLEGCVYVCKQAGPRCIEEEENNRCTCASPGLTKQLVPLDHMAVTARLGQTKCGEDSEEGKDDCGPCGQCVEGSCVLKERAHLGNYCPCGEICPTYDERSDNKGGKILCQPNWKIECMAKPTWMVGRPSGYEAGTAFPDLCTDGKTDSGDTCGCAVGYEEKLEMDGTGITCVSPTASPSPDEKEPAPVEVLP